MGYFKNFSKIWFKKFLHIPKNNSKNQKNKTPKILMKKFQLKKEVFGMTPINSKNVHERLLRFSHEIQEILKKIT